MNHWTTKEDAGHVLWHYGDYVAGWQPGSFTETLLSAAAKADAENLSKLGAGFPGLIAAVRVARFQRGGLNKLRELATSTQ